MADEGSRDVVVPMPLYKTVTVFSTLIAVVGVVAGFVLLDASVMRGGVVRVAVDGLLSLAGVRVAPAIWTALQPVFAVLGLGAIALGAVVYVLGSRFRAEGMGEDDADDDTDATPDGDTDPTADGGQADSSRVDGGRADSSQADGGRGDGDTSDSNGRDSE